MLHLVWLQQPDTSNLLAIYNKAIDLSIGHAVKFWIADNHRGFNFDVCMQRALAELCATRLYDTQVLRFARIIPMDVFQELVSHKMRNMMNQLVVNEVEFEVFSQVEEAKFWLQQVDALSAIA
ncbi:hypothetical protein [Pontibacter roseus]|uniref:hypothetical protein n=1 Tax=Pontibacter roseus TaxID=336989 RepID=UPI0012F8044D|nr:hypothetical protein [Pontibacter roseus]